MGVAGDTKWGNVRLREDVGVAGNAEWGIGDDRGEKGHARKGAGLGNNAVSTVGNLQYFTLPPLVRADSARTLDCPRTLLGLFRVVMLYIILIGFLS